MLEIKQTATFMAWERKLRDHKAKALIAARVFRLANGLLGDVSPVGQGVSELRIHYGPGYRVYFQQRGSELVILLCGGDKGTQSRDIEIAKKPGEPVESRMNEPLYDYDPASALSDPESIAIFMADAFETGDAAYIAQAMGVVARAKGMTDLARESGLSREQLYRSFSDKGNPTLKTLLAVMRAFGVDLTTRAHVKVAICSDDLSLAAT